MKCECDDKHPKKICNEVMIAKGDIWRECARLRESSFCCVFQTVFIACWRFHSQITFGSDKQTQKAV